MRQRKEGEERADGEKGWVEVRQDKDGGKESSRMLGTTSDNQVIRNVYLYLFCSF